MPKAEPADPLINTSEAGNGKQLLPGSVQLVQSIFNNSIAAQVVWTGEDLIIRMINERMLEMLGRDASAIGKSFLDVMPEFRETPLLQRVLNVLKTGEDFYQQEEKFVIIKNGKPHTGYFNYTYQVLTNAEGKNYGVISTAMEVTDQVVARKEVEERAQELKAIVASAPFPISVYIGKDMRIQLANQSMMDIWGKGNDILGKLYFEVLPEVADTPIFEQLMDVYNTGIAYHAKNQFVQLMIGNQLQPFYFNYSFTPLLNAAGEVYGVMNTGADVTELNNAYRKTEDSAQNLRNIILQAPVAMCIFKEPNHIVEIANDRMYELWGKKAEEVQGRPIFDAIPEIRSQGFEELLNNVYYTGKTFKANGLPVTLPRNNGVEVVYVNFVYEALKEADGRISGVMAVAVEVTEQVLARQKIQDSEDRLLLSLESGDLGTFEVDYSCPGELKTTEKFNRIFGFDRHVSRQEFTAVIHPDDVHMRNKAHEDALTSGRLFYEVRLLKKDGKINWIRAVGKVIYTSEQKPQRLLGIVQDITEQKNVQQQKDNFIAMASHELKTPVTSIKVYIQLLEQMLLDKGDIHEAGMISRVDSQVDRLTKLIEDLLNITRLNSGKLEYHKSIFDFNELVTQMIEELQRTTTVHKLVLKLNKPMHVNADRERLGQVITNFISNAIKYSPDAQLINISTAIKGQEVIFCVEDYGIGIDSESVNKVFEQFYRVNNDKHQTFPGLGLGLHISSEIIKREGGKIWAESIEGAGSQFYFSIPFIKD